MPALSLSLQGYSKSENGEKWALLTISNRDECDLCLMGPTWLVFTNHLSESKMVPMYVGPNPVPRGSSCQAAVAIPAEAGSWRFQCAVIRDTWRDKLGDRLPDRVDDLVPGARGCNTMANVDTGWVQQ